MKSHLHEIRGAECRCGLFLITSLRKDQTAVVDVSQRFSAVEAGCGVPADRPDRSLLSCQFSGYREGPGAGELSRSVREEATLGCAQDPNLDISKPSNTFLLNCSK